MIFSTKVQVMLKREVNFIIRCIVVVLLTGTSLVVTATDKRSPITITGLKTDYRVNPLGIDNPEPRLFWQLVSSGRNQRQTAYRVLISKDPIWLAKDSADVWDSGEVISNSTIQIPIGNFPLISRTRYYWKVKIWDQDHLPSAWSEIAWWEMGLLQPTDWQAQWIRSGLNLIDTQYAKKISWPESATIQEGSQRAVRFTKPVHLSKPIKQARVYATARGLYQLNVNGIPTDELAFNPGWTDYRQRIPYQVFDVSASLKKGNNTLALELAHGWYAGSVAFYGLHQYEKDISFLLQLEITHTDLTTTIIRSDTSWNVGYSPIVANDVIHGESYDARKEQKGWDKPGFRYNFPNWTKAKNAEGPKVKLVASHGPAVTKYKEFQPESIIANANGTYTVDMGQNFAGIVRLKARGKKGTPIKMRFAEMLSEDGNLHIANLYGARQEINYVLNGNGTESFTPKFCMFGFRYIEISGYTGALTKNDITGIALTGNHQNSGSLVTSDKSVNQLISNINWSFFSNFTYVPTDCPQRIERQGWMGDAGLFAGTSVYLADMATYYSKWMQDVEDAQFEDGAYSDVSPRQLPIPGGPIGGTGGGTNIWGDAGIVIPWIMYQTYGDKQLLKKYYGSMKRWIDYCRTNSVELIRPDKLYGDWLPPSVAGTRPAPNNLVNTAYFAYATNLFAKMAAVLGKQADAEQYQGLFNAVKASFNQRFLTPNAYFKMGGKDTIPFANQTLYALGLEADLFPEEKTSLIVDRLVQDIDKHGCLTTGIAGTRYINRVLSRYGKADKAYTLLYNRNYPSWLNQVELGATSIGEHWSSFSHDWSSRNHVALGAVGEWMYQNMAGITMDESQPAFQRIIFQPDIHDSLQSVAAAYSSIRGRIRSEWKIEGRQLHITIEVPVNSTASIRLPVSHTDQVSENGKAVQQRPEIKYLKSAGGFTFYELGSGLYQFTMLWNRPR